jgi:poly(3-hydroxybutyrate) depolymerase
LARQYLRFNGHPSIDAAIASETSLPPADRETRAAVEGRTITTRDWRVASRLVVRLVTVDLLGHAWSGGDAKFPFNDSQTPDASALIAAFVREAIV